MENNGNEIIKELLAFARKTSRSKGDLSNIFAPVSNSSGVDKSKVFKALQDPNKNAEVLQKASATMLNTQGILKEFLMYKANILTYDHYILPTDMSKFANKDALTKSEFQAALELERYNIKFNLSWMMESLIQNGILFIYKTHTKQSLVIHEIPITFCKVIGSINGVMKYAINLTAINDRNILSFPEDIRLIHERYVSGKLKNDINMIDDKHYLLRDNAACFNLKYMNDSGVPYYSHTFPELLNLEDIKEAETEAAIINTFKLIVQKIPLDEDGEMKIEEEIGTLFHQAMKRVVPDNIGVITTPLPVESINLNDTGNTQSNRHENIRNNVYDSAGINDELFNGKKSSNEAIALGSVLDTLLPIKLLKQFEMWINEDLKANSKTKNWKVNFIDSTKYNQESKLKFAKEMITTYYPKKQYFALTGMTPLDVLNTLQYEEMSEISDRMTPLQTSHTMSTTENAGRPSNADSLDTNLSTGQSDN